MMPYRSNPLVRQFLQGSREGKGKPSAYRKPRPSSPVWCVVLVERLPAPKSNPSKCHNVVESLSVDRCITMQRIELGTLGLYRGKELRESTYQFLSGHSSHRSRAVP